MAIKSVSIRIEEEMLNKIAYIADYEGRSVNSQVLVLIRDNIKKLRKKMAKSTYPHFQCSKRVSSLQAFHLLTPKKSPIIGCATSPTK